MTCVHLNQLFQLCRQSDIQVSSTDLIRFVCRQCQQEEVCPAVLYEEYDQLQAKQDKDLKPENSTVQPEN
jgi:hypothetical protein